MGYEINVSLNGRHFFATHERSCVSEFEMKPVLKTIKEKFLESEGYKISLSYNQRTGKIYSEKEIEHLLNS